MDIYLTDLQSGTRMRFPMLPERVDIRAGTNFQSYNLLRGGEIKLPYGDKLIETFWSGILPGRSRQNFPYVRQWRDPDEIRRQWRDWRQAQKVLRLLGTGMGINRDVYIRDYELGLEGGSGDRHYTIHFVLARNLGIDVVQQCRRVCQNVNQNQPVRPAPPPARTHTVVKGDTLWGIAQRFLGAGRRYPEIYNANKNAIEAEARRRGMEGSNRGWWIFPGTVLTIPG